jgi:hypothetical protein
MIGPTRFLLRHKTVRLFRRHTPPGSPLVHGRCAVTMSTWSSMHTTATVVNTSGKITLAGIVETENKWENTRERPIPLAADTAASSSPAPCCVAAFRNRHPFFITINFVVFLPLFRRQSDQGLKGGRYAIARSGTDFVQLHVIAQTPQ